MIFYFAMVMVLTYYLLFILYYQSLFPAQSRNVLRVVLVLTLVVASYVTLSAWNVLSLNFPSVTAIMIVGLRFCTGMNWKQAAYGGGFSAITAYCFRGGFIAITALLHRSCDFLYNANAYYAITLLALPASLLFFSVLRRKLLPDDKLKQFLKNDSQLRLVIVYEMAAAINLVVINSGRHLVPGSNWYMEIALGACALTLFMLIYAVYQSIRSSELLDYQWRTKTLEEQYDRQLQHYVSYQKYTESYRVFRHDYTFMMSSLKTLIHEGDNEKAVQLMDDIYEDMQKKVQIHKKYSDNLTLDAMLQDLANICEAKEIRFACNAFAPRNTNLALLDAIRIFSNIASNAVEACEKVPIPDRFIEITSGTLQQWATLEIINSYDGQVIVENRRFVSTKSDKASHGLGLGIVQELAENEGGFVMVEADQEKRIFLTRIHIPHKQDKSSPPL